MALVIQNIVVSLHYEILKPMNRLKRYLCMLQMAVFVLTASAHYYNNVRVNDTPIRCLAQDESNLIWLGTGNGLYCYDGYRCIPKYAMTESMRSTVYCLQSEGYMLYVGTSRGFFIYDTRTHKSYQPQQEGKEVRAIALSNDGVMVGMPDGLWKYESKKNQLHQLTTSPKDIYALEQMGNITYVGALKGFFCYKEGKVQEITLRQGEHPYVNSLLADKQHHCIWVGTGDMLYQYDIRTEDVREIPEMNGVSVKAMSLADDETLYIATDNGFYTYQNGHLDLDKHDARNPHTLLDNVVWSTLIDHWGNIILGTDGGLSVISAASYFIYHPISQLTGQGEGNKFTSLLKDTKGRKWLGGSNGVLLIDHSFKKWYSQIDKENPITHNRIRQVYEDLSGNIWIATDNGINLYEEKTGRMRNLIIIDKTGEYTARWAYDIIDDGQGNLWVAAFSGGIFIASKEKLLANEGIIVADKYIGHKENGLSDLWVRQLKKDGKGNIWARTGKGLDCVNISGKKVHNILKEAPGFMISDKDGNIWIANSKEILCYSDANHLRRYSYGEEHTDIEAVALCDVNRQIWIVTSKECILIGNNGNHQRLRIPVVDAYGASYSASDKCLYIGGQDGIVEMYPSEISENSQQRKLVLTDFSVNGKQRLIEGNNIILSHNENNIELRLTDYPYMGDVLMSYVYRLEGIDNVWHIMNSLEVPIVYNALPYGKYTLRICGINGTDHEKNELFTTEIRILPPWYLTLWAKVLYALIIQGFILWMVRFYIVRRQLKREKQEKQRILEQSKTRLDFYNNMSRHLKQALHQVMAPLSELVAQTEGSQLEAISSIRSHTTRMNTLIRKAFDIGNIEEVKAEMPLSRINVVAFCRETLKSMKPIAEKQQIQLALDTDSTSILMETEVLRLDSILSIIIQNMLRHSTDGSSLTVSLDTNLQTDKVNIFVNSSTMSVPDSLRPYFFQRYRQQKDESIVMELGDDFYLAKDYMEELGGKITIEPATGQGTTIKMVFDILSEKPVTTPIKEGDGEHQSLLSTTTDDFVSEKDEKLMREITMTIEANLIDSDFNVTRLQEMVGIGQKLLYRKIKQIAGVTPVEYIRNIRMEKAARLLREGRFSISEVMYMVGFTKSGYFSKCFQEAFGMTPSTYIRQTNYK